MTTAHTPIIANMCDECTHITKFMGCEICNLHNRPLELSCVKNNKPCPDYHKKSIQRKTSASEISYRSMRRAK